MHQESYWSGIDIKLVELAKNGYVKLPSLEQFGLNSLAIRISSDMNGGTFSELCCSHKLFLQKLGVEEHLTPKLFEIARDGLGFKGDISNQYHVSRRVELGNASELYRSRFDSHRFTMVLPIKIPSAPVGESVGELLYLPHARRPPKTEFGNFLGKAVFKRFANKK